MPHSLPLEGVLSTSEADLVWAAQDFGRVVHHRPLAVLHAASRHDVAAVQRFAQTHDLTVVPRAQGHSTHGQAQAPGGIVLNLNHLDTVHHVSPDRMVVDAGATWSKVVTAALAHGATPPVLTDYLELSVGGTLSVGGLGGASHRRGAQTDNVLELDVITPDGTLRTCSPALHPDLFDAVRAGYGRHGVIVQAALRLVPAPTHARTYRLRYRHLPDLLAAQRRLVTDQRFDYLEGQAKLEDDGTWTHLLEAAHFFTPPAQPDDTRLLAGLPTAEPEITDTTYWDFANRLADDVALLRRIGPWQHPHPWNNLLLPDNAVEEVVTTALSEVDREGLGDSGLVLLYPIPRDRLRTPQLHVPSTPIIFLLAVLRTAPPDSPATLGRMLEHNQRTQDLAITSGGTIYLRSVDGTGGGNGTPVADRAGDR
ncbi:FAD-binding protein [Saccharothrix sp.]|uniref:FAD-binding protein n=1 Tax=Saccharothrix sp. TaxID=1873460 RepID=UPI002811015F|nr:FAD-binding protein [Saccharothrix sp.]